MPLSNLLMALCLTAVLILSITGSSLLPSNALIQRDFTYLNDRHLTALTGNTMVCGDHLCAKGEWEKLKEALNAAQLSHTTRNATQGTKHMTVPSTMGDSSQTSGSQATPNQISPTIPGTPFPIPSPIPTPVPTPQTALKSVNQTSAYVRTDKPSYELSVQQEALVHIYGQIPNLPNGVVTVSVKSPYGVYKVMTTYTGATGSFSLPYVVGFNAPAGRYDITADYKGGEVSGSFFVVRI